MIPTFKLGKLLVFDYVPNLKVVGTYHGLNHQDEEVLENLVQESDFVALEYDDTRMSNGCKTNLCPRINKRGYNPEKYELYISPLDYLCLKSFISINNRTLKLFDYLICRKDPNITPRNFMITEFDFCIQTAERYKKDLYLVDVPIIETFTEFTKLPLSHKFRVMLGPNGMDRSRFIKQILMDKRENHMLKQIKEKEGCPLQELERKGILVVGLSHAENYYENRPN